MAADLVEVVRLADFPEEEGHREDSRLEVGALDIAHGFGGPHYHYWGSGRFAFGRPYGTGCSCGGGFTIILIILMLFAFSDFFNGCAINYNRDNVAESSKTREPLQGVVSKTDWYEDELGWISSEKVLISGLEDFYKETGVQPYVLFVEYSEDLWNGSNLDPTKADEYLENYYEEKFEDEGHFIFAYFQCQNDSKQEMEGEFRYLSGYSVDTIMDNEAIDIFWGYFETNYYNTSLTIEEMISNTFTKTAENIMQNSEEGSNIPMVLSIILIVIIVIVIIYAIVKNVSRKKKEQVNKPADVIIEKNEDENK